MMNSYGHGFYLTLPSESSKDLFPENNASEYNVRLPHWIDLKGNWEIGLHSITYTRRSIIHHLDGTILYEYPEHDRTTTTATTGKMQKSSYRLLEWGGSDVTTGSVGFSGSFGASDPIDTSGCDVTSAPFSQNIGLVCIRGRRVRGWDLAKGLGLGERESAVGQGSGGSAILVQCGGRERPVHRQSDHFVRTPYLVDSRYTPKSPSFLTVTHIKEKHSVNLEINTD